MANDYTMDDILDFLSHAGDKGLMPAATATALAVATRNVFGVLSVDEQQHLESADLEAIIKRFTNKRARDFNPASLKEYARRIRRAVELFEQWRDNPADFSIKTRAPRKSKKETSAAESSRQLAVESHRTEARAGTFQSSFPVGPGRVITVSNVPEDLTTAEADRLAQFVRMLAID